MFCSTIIPTIGRATLSRAVESVLNQTISADDSEVLVVNDSGRPLPEGAWQRSERVRIINTNRHNRSVARNTGAAVARGKYLHFLDDDDWMLPGAFHTLWQLASTHQAAWLYGGYRLVDNAGNLIGDICPEEEGNCFVHLIAWEWIPLQASLIETSAYFAVGGFASLHSLMGGCEDIHLSRVIARHFDMAHSKNVITSIRFGDEGSTTDYANLFRQNRQSRDKALSLPGAFQRLRASVNGSLTNSAYWNGQIIYYYLASLKGNLKQKRFFTAASRGTYALAGFAVAGRQWLSTDFWRGLTKPHVTRLKRVIDASNAKLFAHTVWE
jgi:glycosyltransferase involved in cell wall biosynthesis